MKIIGISQDALVIILGRAFLALGGLVTVRVATELMTPEQMGVVVQMVSLAALFGLVFSVPVWHYMARGFLEWYDVGTLPIYIKQYLIYTFLMTHFILIIAWFIQSQFHFVEDFGIWWVTALAGLYFISISICSIGTNGFNILGFRIHFVLLANIPIWSGLCLAFTLFKVTASAHFWVLGLFLGNMLASFSVVILYLKIKKKNTNPLQGVGALAFDVESVFAFAWPVALTAMLWWLQSQSFRFIIPELSDVGLFAIGYSLAAAPMALYEGLFGQFYEPIYYRELKLQNSDGQAIAWNHYAAFYLPGVILTGLFVASGGHFLASLLLGVEFRAAAETIIIWAAIIETMRGIGGMMYHLGVAKVDSRMNILPVGVSATLSVVAVYLFSRIDPLVGTAMGLFFAGLVALIIILKSAPQQLPIVWPYSRMIKAFLLTIPLIASFWVAKSIIIDATVWISLGILGLGGLYILAVWMIWFSDIVTISGGNPKHG